VSTRLAARRRGLDGDDWLTDGRVLTNGVHGWRRCAVRREVGTAYLTQVQLMTMMMMMMMMMNTTRCLI